MERFLRAWFFAAVVAIALYAGWLFEHASVLWRALAMGTALILTAGALMTQKDNKIYRTIVAPGCAIVLAVCVGWATAMLNPWHANEWMENSSAYLYDMLVPIHGYAKNMRPIVMSDEQKALHKKNAAKLKLSGYDIGKSMLVSFASGLAILDGKTNTFISGTGVMLSLPHLLPDTSFIYYWPNDSKGTTTKIQRLTRAVIRDGVLHEVWDRGVIGLYVHHWGDEFEGLLYQPGRSFEVLPASFPRPLGIGSNPNCDPAKDIHELIHIFNIDTGELVKSIDLMKIVDSPEGKEIRESVVRCGDVFHLNDVQIVKTQEDAAFFPDGKVGDILVSMRNTSSIALIDKDTLKIKWSVSNVTHVQHSPRITDRGTLMVFDNLGSDPENGRARITEIDIATRKVVGFWEGTSEGGFDSLYRGKITLVGNTIFVQDQNIYEPTNSMFVLKCAAFPISNANCTRSPIWTGRGPEYFFDNAVFIDEDKVAAMKSPE